MATFESLAEFQDSLVRKATTGGVWAAKDTTAVLTAAQVFGVGGTLTALPVGYSFTGLTTDEGLRFGRSVSTEDDTAWQRTEPVRSDVTEDTENIQVDFKETRKTTLELYTGADLSTTTVAANGSLTIDKPATPRAVYYRLFALAMDFYQGQPLYIARFLPRAKVTSWTEQAWAKGAGGIQWGMTLTAFNDPAVGFSIRHMFGGPGMIAAATTMGFTLAP